EAGRPRGVRRVQGRERGSADQIAAQDERGAGAQGGRRARPRVGEDRADAAVAARHRVPEEEVTAARMSSAPATCRGELAPTGPGLSTWLSSRRRESRAPYRATSS